MYQRSNLSKNAIVAIVCILSGCGGAGSPVSVPAPADSQPSGDVIGGPAMRSDASSMISKLSDPMIFALIDQVPTTSIITYRGYLYGGFSSSNQGVSNGMIGKLNLDVDFTPSSVTIEGRGFDFFDFQNNALDGELHVDAGNLNRLGNPENSATLTFSGAGRLSETDGENIDLSLRFEGDFLSDNAVAAGGNVLGRGVINGTPMDFNGGFVVER